jgi:hypothetical protein
MTTILFKHGQFQTEDGIPMEPFLEVGKKILHSRDISCGEGGDELAEQIRLHITEGSTYSIREKVEVIDQQRYYHERDLTWTIWFDKGRYKLSDNDQVESRKVARIIEEKEESEEQRWKEVFEKMFDHTRDPELFAWLHNNFTITRKQ